VTSVGVHPHQAHQFAGDSVRAVTTVRDQLAATAVCPGGRGDRSSTTTMTSRLATCSRTCSGCRCGSHASWDCR
jgi:hypothetical protein